MGTLQSDNVIRYRKQQLPHLHEKLSPTDLTSDNKIKISGEYTLKGQIKSRPVKAVDES